MVVLLTGASGFVGKAILKKSDHTCLDIRPIYRSHGMAKRHRGEMVVLDWNEVTDWTHALTGVDVVIHSAAFVEIKKDHIKDPLVEYMRVNVEGTLNLARQAALAGVRRFIFISSIKVNGEETFFKKTFAADDIPAPVDAYAKSKAEAEVQLKQLTSSTGMEVVIIRSPIVYGPNVKNNFLTLIKLVKFGIPLPLKGLTHNRRSMVGIDNLVDLILICVDHPMAVNNIFLVSDGEDISTSELIEMIGKCMGRPVRMFWLPTAFILLMGYLLGKRSISRRLVGSLQLDINKTRRLLGWRPSISMSEGVRRAVEQFQ